jgi:lipopolysaccharide export system protein LptA
MSAKRGVICLLMLAAAASSGAAQGAPAPSGRCHFQFEARNKASPPRANAIQLPTGEYNSFIGGGFRGHCASQGITIVADSLESYGDTKVLYLIGNVHYTEPRLNLDANRVTYWQNEERLRAEGRVDATLPSGTNLEGPVVDYYRAVRGIRLRTRMVAPGRPTIRIQEADSTGKTGDPVTVVANNVVMDADSLVYASGEVVLTRPDMVARGDSIFVDNGSEYARLMRGPVVEGKGERPFTLTGKVIDVFGKSRQLERALSIGDAKAVSEDAVIVADTLDFRLTETLLQRAFAWGPTGARVTSPTYDVRADSLDVRMPDQNVQLVHAVGHAYAESEPDSLRIHSDERDWMRGDTIIAMFDTAQNAATDTGAVRIRRLEAQGSAQSFYQLPPNDTTLTAPAINYVRGKSITVAFEDRQVQQVSVDSQATGLYLEPAPPVLPDSTARPDTTRRRVVTPPTGRIGPPTKDDKSAVKRP